MKPRIYLYKVTFEEIPDFYWGVHKERKFNDGYLGSPVTHRWKWEFYTPHLQILQLFDYSDEGWKLSKEIERKIIALFLNNPRCLNENCGGSISLEGLRRGGVNGGRIGGKVGCREKKRKWGAETARLGIACHTPENRLKGRMALTDDDVRRGGIAVGSLPWWVSAEGVTKRSQEKPPGQWKRGRKWKD